MLIFGFISWPLVFTGTIRVEGNEQQLAEASLLITVIGHIKKKKKKQAYTRDLDIPFSKFPSSLVLRIFLHFEVDQTSCSGAVTCRGIL